MDRIRVATRDVPAERRLDYWREHFGAVWGDIDCIPLVDQAFDASLESRRFGALRFNRITSRGLHLKRRAGRGTHAFFSLAFPLAGSASSRLGGSETCLQPGHLYLLDNRESGSAHGQPDYATFNVQIPAELLEHSRVVRSAVISAPLAPGTGRASIVQHFVTGLAGIAEECTAGESAFYERQLCDLIAFTFDGRDGLASEDDSVRAAHRERALDVIEREYDDESLAPESIAARCGISVNYLHRVFRGSGASVMQHVRRIRLERAHVLLRDSRFIASSVSEIGYRCGFSSASEFSKACRAHFGRTPKQLRNDTNPSPVRRN